MSQNSPFSYRHTLYIEEAGLLPPVRANVNDSWCRDIRTVHKHCSPDVERLLLQCRPYYLPREFTAVFLATVYIPLLANSTAALNKLHDVISALETAHLDLFFIVAGHSTTAT